MRWYGINEDSPVARREPRVAGRRRVGACVMPSGRITVEALQRGITLPCECGSARAWCPSDAILVLELVGDLDAGLAPRLAAALDAFLSSREFGGRVFVDLERLHYLAPAIRSAVTDALWNSVTPPADVHLLATNPWARLAASVTALALALDEVHITQDRAVFEAALVAASVRRDRRTTASEVAEAIAVLRDCDDRQRDMRSRCAPPWHVC